MNTIEAQAMVEMFFGRIRRQKCFQLGISELAAALDALHSGWVKDEVALQKVLRLLWCHAREDRAEFDASWEEVWQEIKHQSPQGMVSSAAAPPETLPASEATTEVDRSPLPPVAPAPLEMSGVGILATQSPPAAATEDVEIWSSLPVSRRALAYGWRSLRRLQADGIWDVVDVPGTIAQTARQGFYVAPVFGRRLTNHARLLLLIDREGSMVPFHRFSRDVEETAREDCEQMEVHLQAVQVAYFHNVPYEYVYEDDHLTKPIALKSLLEWCDLGTSVLIISDGGAARGTRRLDRIRATTKFLVNLQSHTGLVSWLNPVPQERWEGTSAEILAYTVPMEVMNAERFSVAIDVVRG